MVIDSFYCSVVPTHQYVQIDLGRESEVHGYEYRSCVYENRCLVAVFVLASPGPGVAVHINNDRGVVAGREYVEGFVRRRAIGDVEQAIQGGAHLGAVAPVSSHVIARIWHQNALVVLPIQRLLVIVQPDLWPAVPTLHGAFLS